MAFASAAILVLSVIGCTKSADNSITVAQGSSKGFLYLPFLVAEHENYFEANGLKVKTLQATGPAILSALLSGNADIGTNSPSTITAAARGQYLPIIAAVSKQFPADIIISSKALSAAHIEPSAPIANRIKALKGMKIGITSVGSRFDAGLRYVLPKYGLTPDSDVTLVPLGTTSAEIAALKAGAIDGYIDAAPSPQQARAEGLGKILISFNNGEVPEMAGYVEGYEATPAIIKSNPKAVQAFVDSIAQALKFIHDNPDKAAAIAAQANPNLTGDIFTSSYSEYRFALPTTPVYSVPGFALNNTIVHVAQPKLPPVDTDKLINLTFATAAAKKYGLSLSPDGR
jgi:NitT/TauT family transport system substrate-binding protein